MALSPEAKAIGDRPYFPVPETFLPDPEGGIADNMWFPATSKGITIREQAVMTFMAAYIGNSSLHDDIIKVEIASLDAGNKSGTATDKYDKLMVESSHELADAYLESLAAAAKDGAK